MGHAEPGASTHARGAAHEAGAPHSAGRMHVTVAIVLAALTVVAFGAVWANLLPTGLLLPALLALALIQILLQTLFYMRLRWDSRMFAAVFGGGVCLAILIALAVKTLLAR
jgi:heme/copper-type cytochrome/quinol oxidase subunit 4